MKTNAIPTTVSDYFKSFCVITYSLTKIVFYGSSFTYARHWLFSVVNPICSSDWIGVSGWHLGVPGKSMVLCHIYMAEHFKELENNFDTSLIIHRIWEACQIVSLAPRNWMSPCIIWCRWILICSHYIRVSLNTLYILQNEIAYSSSSNVVPGTEHRSEFVLTINTPYLAPMGELWGVYCEDLGGKWPYHNCTVLYMRISHSIQLTPIQENQTILQSSTSTRRSPPGIVSLHFRSCYTGN